MPQQRRRVPASADTIAAVATAAGRAGVGIVRISGPQAARVAQGILGALPTERRAVARTFRDAQGSALDFGLALWFPAPGSFTGEDVLELHGHGGPVVLRGVLGRCLELGARLADPGEFNNLAADHKLADERARHRAPLDAWMKAQGDRGQATEMEALQHMKRYVKDPGAEGGAAKQKKKGEK